MNNHLDINVSLSEESGLNIDDSFIMDFSSSFVLYLKDKKKRRIVKK